MNHNNKQSITLPPPCPVTGPSFCFMGRERALALTFFLPGRCTTEYWYGYRARLQHVNLALLSLKRSSHSRDRWSVWIVKGRPIYPVRPRNVLTCDFVWGGGVCWTAWIFVGSGLTNPLPTTCPRYTHWAIPNWHLLRLAVSPDLEST